jgi:hypothetical protein
MFLSPTSELRPEADRGCVFEARQRECYHAGGGTSMAIRGSCLCGGVTFEIDRACGPAEFCHCNRCRKLSAALRCLRFA